MPGAEFSKEKQLTNPKQEMPERAQPPSSALPKHFFLSRASVQLFRLEAALGDGCGDVVVVRAAWCGAM